MDYDKNSEALILCANCKAMDKIDTVENNFVSIRLDTFSLNHRNNKFYKSRGYTRLEDVFFPMQSEFPFHCYEKILP